MEWAGVASGLSPYYQWWPGISVPGVCLLGIMLPSPSGTRSKGFGVGGYG